MKRFEVWRESDDSGESLLLIEADVANKEYLTEGHVFMTLIECRSYEDARDTFKKLILKESAHDPEDIDLA